MNKATKVLCSLSLQSHWYRQKISNRANKKILICNKVIGVKKNKPKKHETKKKPTRTKKKSTVRGNRNVRQEVAEEENVVQIFGGGSRFILYEFNHKN